METIWKPIPGYEGLYQASNTGQIRSVTRDTVCTLNSKAYKMRIKARILKQTLSKGYCQVTLSAHGCKVFQVHYLIALSFLPNPDGYFNVKHKDGNIRNNNVENLEWVKTKRHPKTIVQKKTDGTIICTYESVEKASECTGVSKAAIYQCTSGKSRTAGKFIWSLLSQE